MEWEVSGRRSRDTEYEERSRWEDRQKFFDPFSGSAGVDRDFDDPKDDELYIKERLRDRGTF